MAPEWNVFVLTRLRAWRNRWLRAVDTRGSVGMAQSGRPTREQNPAFRCSPSHLRVRSAIGSDGFSLWLIVQFEQRKIELVRQLSEQSYSTSQNQG